MIVKLVLNGGIKSCCSVTSTEVVEKSVRAWLPKNVDLVVIDKTTEAYTLDSLAHYAENFMHDAIYPLLYIDDTLAMIGGLPDREDLRGLVNGTIKYGITEEEIYQGAKSLGYVEEEQAAAL